MIPRSFEHSERRVEHAFRSVRTGKFRDGNPIANPVRVRDILRELIVNKYTGERNFWRAIRGVTSRKPNPIHHRSRRWNRMERNGTVAASEPLPSVASIPAAAESNGIKIKRKEIADAVTAAPSPLHLRNKLSAMIVAFVSARGAAVPSVRSSAFDKLNPRCWNFRRKRNSFNVY